jgi:hypothetical protein
MIERVIDECHRDLGGFRVLPWPERQARGSYVVFDRGPAEFSTRLSGKVDIEIMESMHRASLGTAQPMHAL